MDIMKTTAFDTYPSVAEQLRERHKRAIAAGNRVIASALTGER
jgi:hypothetical protein